MNSTNPLESVFFITLPDDYSLPENAFKIDTTIPLPVQSSVKNPSEFDMNSLTWEMILAGILSILAYDINNKHIHYYRSLLTSVKPNIKTELTQAAILKVKNEDFDIAEEIFTALHGLDPEDMGTMIVERAPANVVAEEKRRQAEALENKESYTLSIASSVLLFA